MPDSKINQATIMLVEDEPTSIALLAEILHDHFELVVARCLEEAMAQFSPQVDIVVLDLNLPDGSGIEFVQWLQDEQAIEQPPVVVVSAQANNDSVVSAFEHGAMDYVVKPIHPVILLSKLKTMLDLKYKTELLKSQAIIDGLTGIANRAHFEQQFEQEFRRACRMSHPLGLALIDLDNFKTINDSGGHLKGDRCLKALADCLKECFCRAGDSIYRIGGDEFAVLLAGARLEQTVRAAGRFYRMLGQRAGAAPGEPAFTVSIGCSSLVPQVDQPRDALFKMADDALYEAKEVGGRNCVRPEL